MIKNYNKYYYFNLINIFNISCEYPNSMIHNYRSGYLATKSFTQNFFKDKFISNLARSE